MDKYGNKITIGDWIFDGTNYYKIRSISKYEGNTLYAVFMELSGDEWDTFVYSREMEKIPIKKALILELSRG